MSYEQLDAIADAVIPLAFIFSLTTVFMPAEPLAVKKRCIVARLGVFIVLLLLAYSVMFLDQTFKVWPHFSLDYSTHTAVFLCEILYLSIVLKKYRYLYVVLFGTYLALMYYQGYHTIADMLSTVLVILPLAVFILYALNAFCCQAFGDIPVFLRKTRAKAELSS